MFKAKNSKATDPLIGGVQGDYVGFLALDHSDGYKVSAWKRQDNPAL
ncbi:MAG: hypothetical protein ACRDBL_04865 [Rhabdaerophilum sp.]